MERPLTELVSQVWCEGLEKMFLEGRTVPKIEKSTIREAPRPAIQVPANGSILRRTIPVSKIKDDWVRMCVYGPNRVGKTWLACQFPKPLLIASTEPNPTGGARTVKKVPGVCLVQLTSTKDGLDLCRELQATGGTIPDWLLSELGPTPSGRGWPSRFQTFVLDGATSYQDIVLMEVMGWDKVPEQLSFGAVGKERYQERAERTKEGLRPFTKLPMDVIFLGKEKDHNKRSDDITQMGQLGGKVAFQPSAFYSVDAGGAVAGWIYDNMDFMARLVVEPGSEMVESEGTFGATKGVKTKREVATGKEVRKLLTSTNPNKDDGRGNWHAGFRISMDPGRPRDSVPFIVDPTYDKIVKVLRGEG